MLMDVISDAERRLVISPFDNIKFKNKFRPRTISNCSKRLLYYDILQAGFDSVETAKIKLAVNRV